MTKATEANLTTQTLQKPERLVTIVATAVGLSIMGDSLMYAMLGLEAEMLGISLAGVGWLLSANRWIRLLSNTLAGNIFERFGPRIPFIGAAILGFVAGIQMSANQMVRIGDWIEMPKYGADGDVIDITLTTVKV